MTTTTKISRGYQTCFGRRPTTTSSRDRSATASRPQPFALPPTSGRRIRPEGRIAFGETLPLSSSPALTRARSSELERSNAACIAPRRQRHPRGLHAPLQPRRGRRRLPCGNGRRGPRDRRAATPRARRQGRGSPSRAAAGVLCCLRRSARNPAASSASDADHCRTSRSAQPLCAKWRRSAIAPGGSCACRYHTPSSSSAARAETAVAT